MDLNKTWTHIHLWLLFKNLVRTFPGIYTHELGSKTAFWDRLWT